MNNLPPEIIQRISDFQTPKSFLLFIQINTKIRNSFKDEEFWKLRIHFDFPWFLWSGNCEYCPSAQPAYDNFRRFQSCKSSDCKVKTVNPYHQLPTNNRQAYFAIINGKYSGILEVLDSLQNRLLSAYTAIATFDPGSESFFLSYNREIIARYRLGEMIILTPTSSELSESIPISDFSRFRRIPACLLEYDPREIYTKELFNIPLSSDGRPLYYPGEEVEIQWKFSRHAPFAWWRGIVAASYLDPGFSVPTNSTVEMPNIRFSDDFDQGILVSFPQYDENSIWKYVVVSLFGNEQVNIRGFVGGIRRINCWYHRKLWNFRFPIARNLIANQNN